MKDENSPFTKASLTIVIVLLILMAFVFSSLTKQHLSQPDFKNAYLYQESSRNISEFTLHDPNNEEFAKQDLQGKWSFIFFGYTHCPDICPQTLQSMKLVANTLKKDNTDSNTQFLFISVDTERDQLEQLKNYVEYFNPSFLGLSGNQQQLLAINKIFDTTFDKIDNPENPDFYYMGHSAAIYITNPNMQRFALLPPPHKPDDIVADFYHMQTL